MSHGWAATLRRRETITALSRRSSPLRAGGHLPGATSAALVGRTRGTLPTSHRAVRVLLLLLRAPWRRRRCRESTHFVALRPSRLASSSAWTATKYRRTVALTRVELGQALLFARIRATYFIVPRPRTTDKTSRGTMTSHCRKLITSVMLMSFAAACVSAATVEPTVSGTSP